MDLARRYPEVIEEFEKYVPGASSRLTPTKHPRTEYITTSLEQSTSKKLKLEDVPGTSTLGEFTRKPMQEYMKYGTPSQHSTASKPTLRKYLLTEEEEELLRTEDKTD